MIWLVLACKPEPVSDSGAHSGAPSPLREVTSDGKLRNDAQDTLAVEVLDGETAFQVTATSPGAHLTGFVELKDPKGRSVLSSSELRFEDHQVTGAWLPSRATTAFNWPVRLEDGPLKPGVWKVTWQVLTDRRVPDPQAKISYTTSFKADDDPDHAEIHVRILYAKGVDRDPKVVRAIEQAVEHWRDIWKKKGITLVERYANSDLPKDLAFYTTGSKEAEAASADKDVGELQLIVGEEIDGDRFLYGVSAGIPGTVQVSESTFVVLSWLTHAGRDGLFDDDEIDLMGETMAHETGHYAGLFHPVEIYYSFFDGLDDTPDCNSYTSCSNLLGDNLMFPFPVCEFGGGCIPQTKITADQAGVLHTFVGAL